MMLVNMSLLAVLLHSLVSDVSLVGRQLTPASEGSERVERF